MSSILFLSIHTSNRTIGPPLELRHLRYFIAVAEELHFGRAARRLSMSQPPLSTQIRDLERHLGLTLLDRTSRRVSLTPAGRAFLPEARHVLAAADHAHHVAARAAGGTWGSVSLGFLGAAGVSVVPAALMALRADANEVSIRVREYTTGPSLVEALTHRAIDVALLRPPLDMPEIETEQLAVEPFVAVLPRGHRLARRRWIDVAELLDEPFVLWDRTSSPRVFDPVFSAAGGVGEPTNVIVEAVGIPSIVGMVAGGLGVSVLPASAVHRRTSDIAVRPLRPPAPTLAQIAAWRRNDLTPIGRRLLDQLRAAAGRAVGSPGPDTGGDQRRQNL